MITVGMNYNIIPGKDDEFVNVFAKVIEIMNGMDGHSDTHLYRDVSAENDYLIVSEWSSEEAFNAFIASDQFRNVANWGKLNVLRDRPRHEIYGAETEGMSMPSADSRAEGASGCPMHGGG